MVGAALCSTPAPASPLAVAQWASASQCAAYALASSSLATSPGLVSLTYIIQASPNGLLYTSAGDSTSALFVSSTVPLTGLYTSEAAWWVGEAGGTPG